MLRWSTQALQKHPMLLFAVSIAGLGPLPKDALDEINRIQTRKRFNHVVMTGSPGFIPHGRRP